MKAKYQLTIYIKKANKKKAHHQKGKFISSTTCVV
jgi:hypothetical protein